MSCLTLQFISDRPRAAEAIIRVLTTFLTINGAERRGKNGEFEKISRLSVYDMEGLEAYERF